MGHPQHPATRRSRQKAEFFAALDGLSAAGGTDLVEDAGAVGLDGVFGDEELGGDFAIAEAAGDEGEDFEFARGDAEGFLGGGVGSERLGGGRFGGDVDFFDDDGFADGFATAGDAESEPDAEGGEECGDERAIEFDGVLDDDEAVLGVLEGGDEEAADETEDEDVALHVEWDGEIIAEMMGRRGHPHKARVEHPRHTRFILPVSLKDLSANVHPCATQNFVPSNSSCLA